MEIRCSERYQQALEHAEKTNDMSLLRELKDLEIWEKNYDATIILYGDVAPLSFTWELIGKNGNRILNGGLIYHGNPNQPLAVQLVSTGRWQVHT